MAINLDHVTEQITVTDTAANASLTVNPKGTGAFNVAAGSSGVNISNGGTVTAITRTVLGGYTSVPSVALSAPTTAGGVQATATCYVQITSATIAGGGTGYTVGDTITMVGGTLAFGGAGTFRVATVSGGVITSVDTPNFAAYAVVPTNPVSITGGTGSGATLNVNYFIGAFTITNAGSGYVEQPTVTFSGGGGSGAAAYATLGSGVAALRGLTSNFAIYTPAGEHTRFVDNGQGNTYWTVYSNPTLISPNGSAANIPAQFSSKGASGINLYTNTGNQLQAVVTHTASAVNYVNITGAATGSAPAISAQGSDTDITLFYQTKGVGSHVFGTRGTTQQFRVSDTGSAVNYLQVNGAVTGSGPTLRFTGSDTNIDGIYAVRGAGNHRFFTNDNNQQQFQISHTASAVNYVQVTGSATNNACVISAQGSDTNVGLTLSNKGVGSTTVTGNSGTHFRVRTDIGSATNYWEAFGSTSFPILRSTHTSGAIQISSGSLLVQTDTAGATQLTVAHTASAVNYVQVTGGATGGDATISAQGSDSSVGLTISSKLAGNISFQAATIFRQRINGSDGSTDLGLSLSGGVSLKASPTGSQVNFVQVNGAATGGRPTISGQGSDTNVDLNFQVKGSGLHVFTGSSTVQAIIQPTTSSVNYLNFTGGTTGNPPAVRASGSDANIDLKFTPQGTGRVQFGTYTGTILTTTGYVEIKDSGGTVRRLLVG